MVIKLLAWLTKYGYWSLLFSWLPIIGDPLCLAAGWLRNEIFTFICHDFDWQRLLIFHSSVLFSFLRFSKEML